MYCCWYFVIASSICYWLVRAAATCEINTQDKVVLVCCTFRRSDIIPRASVRWLSLDQWWREPRLVFALCLMTKQTKSNHLCEAVIWSSTEDILSHPSRTPTPTLSHSNTLRSYKVVKALQDFQNRGSVELQHNFATLTRHISKDTWNYTACFGGSLCYIVTSQLLKFRAIWIKYRRAIVKTLSRTFWCMQ